MPSHSMQDKVANLVRWMRTRTQEARAKGGVFGVSGGVDSALVLALSKKAWGDDCLGLIMPCHSLPEDAEDAMMLLEHFSVDYRVVDLTPSYDALLASLSDMEEPSVLAMANLKPRLRSMTLYYVATLYNYLVVGSSNRAEIHVGYFTKHGDSAVDMLPLANLTKAQVWEMSRYLGVPDKIVEKTPSAGLWRGQTDEEEMGLLYKDLDAYLSGNPVSPGVRNKIEEMHRRTEHKRRMPYIPDLD
ncbi:MAG: NAD(+) synthase [Bacillota bacterium]|jgi:NAD+ synthase